LFVLIKKAVAVSFIALIILGNIWLMSMFTGKAPPAWTALAFFLVSGIAIIGCTYLLVSKYFMGPNAEE
jgi:hypothetical protein